MEKAAFLGLATSPANPTLRQQLKLSKGMGLVVDFVEADSPALAAGVQQNDILTKLNDQLLVDPQQFAVLVRYFKPGDTVKLTVIREAKAVELTATLTEKEAPALQEYRSPLYRGSAWPSGSPTPGQGRSGQPSPRGDGRPMAPGDMPGGRPPSDGPGGGGRQGGDGSRGRGGGPEGFGPPGPPPGFGPGEGDMGPRNPRGPLAISTRTAILVDKDQELRLTVSNGTSRLTVTDRTTGNVSFDGPVDTAEQRQALPQSVRKQLEQLRGYFQSSPAPGPATPATRPAAKALRD